MRTIALVVQSSVPVVRPPLDVKSLEGGCVGAGPANLTLQGDVLRQNLDVARDRGWPAGIDCNLLRRSPLVGNRDSELVDPGRYLYGVAPVLLDDSGRDLLAHLERINWDSHEVE